MAICRARIRAGQHPAEELPPAGCQIERWRAMGGDLMVREWDVPGYTEVRTLGSGGFGDVVLARHDASGTQVAIKYLRRELLSDPEFAGMFRLAVLPGTSRRHTGVSLTCHLPVNTSQAQRRGRAIMLTFTSGPAGPRELRIKAGG